MLIKQTVKYVRCLLAVLMLTGCAGFKKNKISFVENYPPDITVEKKYGLKLSFHARTRIAKEKVLPEKHRVKLEKEFLEVLEESGLFDSRLGKDKASTLVMEVDFLNFGNPAAMVPAFVSGYTFGVLPCWATDNYTLTVKVKTGDEQIYRYEMNDALLSVIWLPMILTTPFKPPWKIAKEVRQNMYKKLVMDMKRDGIFDKN